MGRKRHDWWGYVKVVMRQYPELEKKREKLRKKTVDFKKYEAVQQAIRETEDLPDASLRLKMLDMVYWRQSHNMKGAAIVCSVDVSTAYRWQERFFRTVAQNMGIADRPKKAKKSCDI